MYFVLYLFVYVLICGLFAAGKISVRIPWTNPYSSPTELTLEDVYVLAGPVTDRPYDARREAALQTAIKRKKLEELDRMTEGNHVYK